MFSKRSSIRRLAPALVLALAWALALLPAKAIVGPNWGLVDVPVERLIKNLQALTTTDPKNAQVRFNLARAHSMAYALRTDTLQARKESEKEVDLFGSTQRNVFTVTPTGDREKLKAAREHLTQAIKRYEEGLKLAPNNLAGRLGHAWCIEQSGKKRAAVAEYRKVINAAWLMEKDLKYGPMYGQFVTAEAAGCLIPLLDKHKDKEEINTLQARVRKLGKLPRPISPIVIPLRNGLTARDLEDHSANVAFDADGTGPQKRWTWITRNAGWLVNDPHRMGKITSGLQLFGNVTFWMFWDNGYQALAALDDDRNGMLAGEELRGLAIWRDLNGNGISEDGEVKPLAEWGIVAISCRYVRDLERPDRIAYSPQGVFFRDGSNRSTYDIILRPAIASVD